MADTTGETNGIDYRQLFPWIRLFRAFWIAVDLRKMFLAGLALMALAAGNWAFSFLPFAPEPSPPDRWANGPPETHWEAYFDLGLGYQRLPAGLAGFVTDPLSNLWQIATNWQVVLRPLRTLIEPAMVLFQIEATWSEIAWGWTRLLWALFVWALFGGAITRMAAVQFARDEKIRLGSAVKFSASNFLSYLAAPLLPVVGLGLLWLLCLLAGLIGRTPQAGDILVGIGWIVPLLLAFLMALLLLGLAAGWPLMYAAISTEGSDGFDGFSRSYSFVYGRPWHYLWYAVVAMLYGSAIVFFVSLVFSLVVYLAGWGVSSGMGPRNVEALHQTAPELMGGPALFDTGGDASPTLGTHIVGGWLYAASVLLVGFVYSYFWTAATLIYFLLRRDDDATDFHEVYLPEEEESDDLLPLVGVANSDQPVIERPVQEDPKPDSE